MVFRFIKDVTGHPGRFLTTIAELSASEFIANLLVESTFGGWFNLQDYIARQVDRFRFRNDPSKQIPPTLAATDDSFDFAEGRSPGAQAIARAVHETALTVSNVLAARYV